MVPILLRLTPILAFLGLVTACDSQKETTLQKRVDQDNFFHDIEKSGSISDLKNEMATGETDFLRRFSDDAIPWQRWDSSLLEKARKCQAPIFLLVGSSISSESRLVGKEISETPELNALVVEDFVCAVADIYANPELGILSFHLTMEANLPASFPTLIWMSHEGSPIASLPIPGLSRRNLSNMIKNTSAMVSNTWSEDSRYVILDSRRNNEDRQTRFNQPSSGEIAGEQIRTDIFSERTRQLSALYSAGDRDLDFIGGLIPTSSLELLTLGSVSNSVTREVNQRCQRATTEVIEELLKGALKDHLDGSYFYARRTAHWSLPSFSKNINTQAKVIHMLIQAGVTTGRNDFIEEALKTLEVLQSDWLKNSKTHFSIAGDQDTPGAFLWNWSTLEKSIGRDLIPFAATAFDLEKEGNISTEVDPIGTFFRLNSLRSRLSIPELAEELGLSETETSKTLSQIKAKMLAYRMEKSEFLTETVINCTDLAFILRAWTAAAVVTRRPELLEQAQALAARLSREFIDPEKGLARLPLGWRFIPARASDYGATSIALNELYQLTLNPDYLKLSKKLIDEAMAKLKTDNGLISEATAQDRIIPLQIIQPSMVFSDSSLGLVDLATTQLSGITGTREYDDFRNKVTSLMAPMAETAIVNHTDFIATCAYGDTPLTAIVQGDPSTESGRSLILTLNSKKHLPFLSVRPATGPAPLTALGNLPPAVGEASVVLMRGEQIVGQASSISELEELIKQALFARN